VAHMTQEETQRLLHMEEELQKRVVGQEEAIRAISKAVRRARAGLKDPRRPIGSFMFLGPTGVGKTELAKALAEFLFGSEEALIKLDMSEFMERHNVSRLVGSPPGYVGYEEGGQLTEAVRRRPYSVVLFDEIEKAHPEAFNMLLQILEDGNLTDAKGRRVDFRNTLILMTSNVGAELLNRQAALGFRKKSEDEEFKSEYEAMKEKVLEELRRRFRPEFLNRLDGVIVFRPLRREEIKKIVDILLQDLHKLLAEQELALEVTDAAKEVLAELGYDPQFGARPLKRMLQQLVVDPISEGLLAEEFEPGDLIIADRAEDKNEIVLRREPGGALGVLAGDENLDEIEELFMSEEEEETDGEK